MATHTQSTAHNAKLGTPGKILLGLFAVLMFCLFAWSGASQANATPVTASIGVGYMVNLQPQAGLPHHQLKDGGCNVAAIDKVQRKLVTAGHCSKVGDKVYNRGTYIGRCHISSTTGATQHRVG